MPEVVVANFALEFTRSGITTSDSDASVLTQNAASVQVNPFASKLVAGVLRLGAICNTAAAVLVVQVYFLNATGQPCGTATVTFTAASTADFAANFVGIPDVDAWWPLGGCSFVVTRVVSVSAGNWTLNGTMS